jgi:peptide deformylase
MKEILSYLEVAEIEPAAPFEFITEQGMSEEAINEGKSIISELKEVLNANDNLYALAAPQIGINKRIFCIKFNDTIKTFINPIISKKTGNLIGPETCACLPGKEILISRPEEITVVYYTEDFKYEDNKLLGIAARLFDQQYQLLDGVLPSELGLVSDIEQDGSLADLTEDEFNQAIEIYKQFIETKANALKAEISETEELNKNYRMLKFTEDVINGRTVVSETEGETLAMSKLKSEGKRIARAQAQQLMNAQKAQNREQLKKFLRNK